MNNSNFASDVSKKGFITHIGGIDFKKISENTFEFSATVKNYNLNSIANHNDYEIYALLKPYIKSELIIPKKRIPYFNHRLNTPIYAVDTYMLIIYDKIEYVYIKPILTAFDQIIELDQKNYFNT